MNEFLENPSRHFNKTFRHTRRAKICKYLRENCATQTVPKMAKELGIGKSSADRYLQKMGISLLEVRAERDADIRRRFEFWCEHCEEISIHDVRRAFKWKETV